MIKNEDGQRWVQCKECQRGNYCDI
jgi:hypothetical protein